MDQYEFTVQGHLADYWVEAFDGMSIHRLPGGQTIISGGVVDQSHLHGILSSIRDKNLVLLEVKQVKEERR